jgi:ribosomal protein L11 methyltransferase
VKLVASFSDHGEAEAAVQRFREVEPELTPEVGEIVGDAWRDKYKEHFKPFPLTEHLVVAPPWEDYAAREGERVLVMDPGRAFGTGLHATTSMVARLLEKHRDRVAGARVLDVGTGSGILGLVALAFGADTVVAIDNDREVVEVAVENARRNGFEAAMHVSDIALHHVDGAFDCVVANIRSEVLVDMAPTLAERAGDGALVVLSGVLASEREDVMNAFVGSGAFSHVETLEHREVEDAWVAIALSRG